MKYLVILFLTLVKLAEAQTADTAALKRAIHQPVSAAAITETIAPAADRQIYREMQEDYPGFSSKADNYLRHAPTAAAGILGLSGIKGKHSISEKTLLYIASTAIMSTTVSFFKKKTRQLRPDGSPFSPFPSAHTAAAFAAAEFMSQEYGDRSPWFGVAAYSAATATGILRAYNNHGFSNAIAGAGFGILSARAAYFLYPKVKGLIKGKENIMLSPSFNGKMVGASLSATF